MSESEKHLVFVDSSSPSGVRFRVAVAPVAGSGGRVVCAIQIGDDPELITASQGRVRDAATARTLAFVTETVEKR